mmetsp:Transcript_35565/g.88895  ORF Transcript_35565/g.88895 Transcript_35565/m.88895 type:complete len:207 (+) Transcript_35565:837-1457(+)
MNSRMMGSSAGINTRYPLSGSASFPGRCTATWPSRRTVALLMTISPSNAAEKLDMGKACSAGDRGTVALHVAPVYVAVHRQRGGAPDPFDARSRPCFPQRSTPPPEPPPVGSTCTGTGLGPGPESCRRASTALRRESVTEEAAGLGGLHLATLVTAKAPASTARNPTARFLPRFFFAPGTGFIALRAASTPPESTASSRWRVLSRG